jgi:hypothetical protein
VTGLTNGTTYTFTVCAQNDFGTGPAVESSAVTPAIPAVAPGAVTGVNAVAGSAGASVSWSAPASDGGSALTGYSVQVLTGTTVLRTVTVGNVLSTVVTGLSNGTAYNFRVAAVNIVGSGAMSTASSAVTPRAPATAPSAPRIRPAASGVNGGSITAIANWLAPVSTGGSAVTSYRVTAIQVRANGTATGWSRTVTVTGSVRRAAMALPAGLYRFQVVARNAVGASASSARSNMVLAR